MPTLKHSRFLDSLSPTAMAGILLSMIVAFGSYAFVVVLQHFKLFPLSKGNPLDFSKIQPLKSFDITKTPPYPYRPWRAGKFHMTMGLRKMPEDDWLALDDLYHQEQELRRFLLGTDRNGVMQYLPGSELACEEALECIVNFMTRRYPQYFRLLKENPGYIYNTLTNLTFKVKAPYEQHPLEVAAQLCMEDINLLLKGPGNDNEYYL